MAMRRAQFLACAAIVDSQHEATFKGGCRLGNPKGSGRAHLAAKAVRQPGADFGQQTRCVRRRRGTEDLCETVSVEGHVNLAGGAAFDDIPVDR